MEEKLDLIIQKLDTITERLDKALALIERIHKDTEPSIENTEYLLNVLGDVTGDVLMQGFTGSR